MGQNVPFYSELPELDCPGARVDLNSATVYDAPKTAAFVYSEAIARLQALISLMAFLLAIEAKRSKCWTENWSSWDRTIVECF